MHVNIDAVGSPHHAGQWHLWRPIGYETMFQHFLIPTDGSMLSEDAAKRGAHFAKSIGARITFFHAIEPHGITEGVVELLEATRGDHAKAALAFAAEHLHFISKIAHANGVECETVHAHSDDPAGEIIKLAISRECDLIVMASHGRRGIESIVLGSQTHKVLTRSRIPVLVYR